MAAKCKCAGPVKLSFRLTLHADRGTSVAEQLQANQYTGKALSALPQIIEEVCQDTLTTSLAGSLPRLPNGKWSCDRTHLTMRTSLSESLP